jgi:hypothetical protein
MNLGIPIDRTCMSGVISNCVRILDLPVPMRYEQLPETKSQYLTGSGRRKR